MMLQVLMVLQFLVYRGTVIGFHARSDDLVTIQSKLCQIELQDEDKPIWFPAKSGM